MNAAIVFDIVLGAILAMITVIDWREQRIPDILNGILAIGGIVMTDFIGLQTPLWSAISAACGFASLWAIRWGYERLRGFHGLGLGDVKFFGASGAWVGAAYLPHIMGIAAICALIWISLLVLAGQSWHQQSRLPFGPFLCLGLWVTWLYLTA